MSGELKFTARLTGVVNGQPIKLYGTGRIVLSSGLTDGRYDLEEIPKRFRLPVLSTVLVTGYPNASFSQDRTPNIFSGRSYSYERSIAFREGGELKLHASCTIDADRLTSTFRLMGHAELPELEGIDPLVESWEPVGPGRIRGQFTAAWPTPVGPVVAADVSTDYRIETDDVQAGLVHRFVTMSSHCSGSELRKVQHVRLFRRWPGLDT